MHSTQAHQHVYASNLRQNFGYPLRKPEPNPRLGQPYVKEGLQIGDVGYIDDDGEFVWLFNIKFPAPDKDKLPKEFYNRNLDPPERLMKFAQPISEQGLGPGTVFMTGVVSNLKETRATYGFTATSKTGAILILPDGATLSKLEGEEQLEEFQKYAIKYALQWCRYARRNSLYLITAVYKTKTWTLGSFHDGSPGKEILISRQAHENTTPYMWEYQFNVDHRYGPRNNYDYDVNQTVLIKGFKISVRWDWFRVIERVERSEGWFARLLATWWPIIKSHRLLSRKKVQYFPVRNSSQPLHPLDAINRILLEKDPDAQVAVTHDNTWIEMLGRGLSHADLMQENPARLREFMETECTSHLDPEYHTVYLRSEFEATNSQPETGCDLEKFSPLSPSTNKVQYVITNMRLENFNIDHIYVGTCILVQFGNIVRVTRNKLHASVIEWDDEIVLSSDSPINVTICGAFQLGTTLGTRRVSITKTINTTNLSGNAHMHRLSFTVGKAESCASLLLTLGLHFSHLDSHPSLSHDENPVYMEMTNLGFDTLYAHLDEPNKKCLDNTITCFRCALDHSVLDPTCHAAALFNLATSMFIKCQAKGTYSELNTPIELYREALQLRGQNDIDRPATVLFLAQALLLRYGKECNEPLVKEIQDLVAEIHPDGSRYHQTADTMRRTCRLYQGVNSGHHPTELDKLIKGLHRRPYVPLYGFFDWPHMLHDLGVALWSRVQQRMALGDLDMSIALNKEALRLIPDGHYDRASIVACLGASFLRLLEVRGDLTDIDMSVSLTQLGKMVVAEFDNIPSTKEAANHWQNLRDQIKLISATDTVFQFVLQIGSTAHLSEVQNLADEWRGEDYTPTKCKRTLSVLLSFLRGEGERKMHKLLGDIEWPFKEHKLEEAMEVLQGHMPYFQNAFAGRSKWAGEMDYATKHLRSQLDIEEVYAESSHRRSMKKFVWSP